MHLHQAPLNRKTSNSGFWQAHQLTVEEGNFTNKDFGTLKILDQLTATSEFMNEGNLTVKNLFKVNKGVNKGTIKGEALFLETQGSFRNEGDIYLKTLIGPGVFYNDNILKFSTPDNRHGSIDVAHFRNGGDPKANTRARITGEHVVITDENQDVWNYDDVFVERLQTANQCARVPITFFRNSGHIEAQMLRVDSGSYKHRWENSGTIKTDQLQLSGNRLSITNTPTGAVQTNAFISTAQMLNNRGDIQVKGTMSVRVFANSQGSKLTADSLEIHKGGQFINASKSVVTLKKELKADNGVIQNEGDLVTEGKFVQQTGELINTGVWDHEGDIDLGSTILRNNSGTLIWQNGTWTFSSSKDYVNNGIWVLDQMACSQTPTINNYVTLHLKNSKLNFSFLLNHHNLILSGGQYTIRDGLQSNGLISFLDCDWVFTDDSVSTAPHRLVLDGVYVKKCHPTGEVEAEKSLTYDIQTLPKLIRGSGDVTFSKRHGKDRTLADLEKVSSLGKVSFHVPSITTTQDHEFSNIGHLDLYVDGIFTTHHSFKARGLSIEANGHFICGASNDIMGTIAATHGPLNLTWGHH